MSVAQPSGTVTLVFTDIEGSTRLLAALGDAAYRDALDEQQQAVRKAFGGHGGYEVDTQATRSSTPSRPREMRRAPWSRRRRCSKAARSGSGSGSIPASQSPTHLATSTSTFT